MQIWALQDAKAQLSALIRIVKEDGPVTISVRGEEEVVVISKQKYKRLTTPQLSLGKFLDQSPLKGLDLKLERDRSLPRGDIDL
jgi:prevent-host-death family protein